MSDKISSELHSYNLGLRTSKIDLKRSKSEPSCAGLNLRQSLQYRANPNVAIGKLSQHRSNGHSTHSTGMPSLSEAPESSEDSSDMLAVRTDTDVEPAVHVSGVKEQPPKNAVAIHGNHYRIPATIIPAKMLHKPGDAS